MEEYEVVVPSNCFNLWVMYSQLTHTFEWVAGKEYSLVGTRSEILAALKKLARTDFFSVNLYEVYGEKNPNKLSSLDCDNAIFDEVWKHLGRSSNKVRRNNQKYLPEAFTDLQSKPITEITVLITTIEGRVIIDPMQSILDLETKF